MTRINKIRRTGLCVQDSMWMLGTWNFFVIGKWRNKCCWCPQQVRRCTPQISVNSALNCRPIICLCVNITIQGTTMWLGRQDTTTPTTTPRLLLSPQQWFWSWPRQVVPIWSLRLQSDTPRIVCCCRFQLNKDSKYTTFTVVFLSIT